MILGAIVMMLAVPGGAAAESSREIKQLQSENAALKRTVMTLQKQIGALSTFDQRLKTLERGGNAGLGKAPGGHSATGSTDAKELARLKSQVEALHRQIDQYSSLSPRLKKLENNSQSPSSASARGTSGDVSAFDARLKKIEEVVVVNGSTVMIKAPASLELEAALNVTITAGANATLQGNAMTNIKGGVVNLNGPGGQPIARLGDRVSAVGGTGEIINSSATVFAN